MSSHIEFSESEAERVFSAYIPGFRVDCCGRYRGPATYRGGDNPQALSVDTSQRKWFDFVLNEGGDSIAFVQKCEQCNFREACSIISGIIGRDLLADSR